MKYIVKTWKDYYPSNEPGKYTPCNPDMEKEFTTLKEAQEFYDTIKLEHDLYSSGSYLMNKALWEENGFEPLKVQYADESVLDNI